MATLHDRPPAGKSAGAGDGGGAPGQTARRYDPCPRDLRRCPNLTDSAFRVYVAVVYYDGLHKGCIASNEEIGHAAGGKSLATVRRALEELERLGQVRREFNGESNRHRQRIFVLDNPIAGPELPGLDAQKRRHGRSKMSVNGRSNLSTERTLVVEPELENLIVAPEPPPEAPIVGSNDRVFDPSPTTPTTTDATAEPPAPSAPAAEPAEGPSPERMAILERWRARGDILADLARRAEANPPAPIKATPRAPAPVATPAAAPAPAPVRATVQAPPAGSIGQALDRTLGQIARRQATAAAAPAPAEVDRPAPPPAPAPAPQPPPRRERPKPAGNASAEVLEALARVEYGCDPSVIDRALWLLMPRFKATDRRDSQRCYADLLHRVRRGEIPTEAILSAFRESSNPRVRNPGSLFVAIASKPPPVPLTAADLAGVF